MEDICLAAGEAPREFPGRASDFLGGFEVFLDSNRSGEENLGDLVTSRNLEGEWIGFRDVSCFASICFDALPFRGGDTLKTALRDLNIEEGDALVLKEDSAPSDDFVRDFKYYTKKGIRKRRKLQPFWEIFCVIWRLILSSL